MTRLLVLLLLVFAACAPARRVTVEAPLPTVAERSGYTATASHAEVLTFLRAARDRSRRAVEAGRARDSLRMLTFGLTPEGRALPLIVWGAPASTAEAVRATGKTRVLLVGNIHGGEVDGKEALLELVRALADGAHDAWADSLVLLIAPIYNADGNDRMAPGNRPLQLGPDAGMGERPTAAGLDLNRDLMKQAAPETQALTAILRDWDPHVVVDLHTTNGTLMGYALTYAPPLHPDTPPALDALLRDRWLPSVTRTLLATDDLATWHYGNVPGAFGEPATVPRAWYSFSPQPRFLTNYVGLRGRLGVLSESYSYAPYRERILASRRFAEEVVVQAHANASLVRRLTDAADRASVAGETAALSATWAPLEAPHAVLLGEVDTLRHPATGEPQLRQRRGVRRPETMAAYVRFEATETTTAPRQYVVHFGPHQADVRDLLDRHGIRYEVGTVWGQAREQFVVDSVRVAERPFQGVAVQQVGGRWVAISGESGPPPRLAPALLVSTDQPLGRLAVALLEPRSDDGVVAWHIVGLDDVESGATLPIERIP